MVTTFSNRAAAHLAVSPWYVPVSTKVPIRHESRSASTRRSGGPILTTPMSGSALEVRPPRRAAAGLATTVKYHPPGRAEKRRQAVVLELWWMIRQGWHQLGRAVGGVPRQAAAWRRFWRSYRSFRAMAPAEWRPELRHLYPCLGDDTGTTAIDPTYFYQDAWAFERIVRARPAAHVDVGSHHKYVALLSRVLPVTMVDIRPLSLQLEGLEFLPGSILSLPYHDGSVLSLSSLCVIEHIGLGRYGDPLDPDGHRKALAELKRVVAPGGDLYLSVPLSERDVVHFNAHRCFDEVRFLGELAPFQVVDRAYIAGQAMVRERPPGEAVGCYHLRRPA